MSAEILKFIGKIVASQVFSLVQKHLFKPDTSVLNQIVGRLENLETLIRDIDYANQLRGPARQITYWAGRMNDIMDDITPEIEAGRVPNLTAYNKLCDSLRDEKDGIRFQTESLRATLMGDNLPVDAKPLLKYWEEQEYKKLADENNTTYHARDYVKTLDKKITAIAALLFHGMNLSFFVAYSEKDTERLNNECHTRVTSFRQKLWDTYPLALRHCKQYHYDNDGSYISSGSYFNFYQESDTTGKNWLTINNYWIREISLHTPAGNHSSKLRAFKFVAPDGPLGPLEMHAYWQVDGNSRVRFYDDVPAGGHRTWAYTNSQRGKKTYTIRFKMVPVAVSGGNSEGRRPIKFIPYFEDSKQVTRQDRYNTFGTEWRIEKTSNPQ